MDIYDHETRTVNISDRLKAIREERDLSIRALGRLSGLSANALSVIERGLSSPSVSTLYKIANALEIPVTSFFEEAPPKNDVVYTKGGERYEGLIEPFMVTLEAGTSSGRFPMTHTGHEFVLCLRGELICEVKNQSYHLESGDSLIFDGSLEHEWHNPGNTVTNAVILISCFRSGERPSQIHLASSGGEAK